MERSAGGEECRWRGVQVERGAGGEGCRWRGVQVERGAGGEECRWRGVQVERGARGEERTQNKTDNTQHNKNYVAMATTLTTAVRFFIS